MDTTNSKGQAVIANVTAGESSNNPDENEAMASPPSGASRQPLSRTLSTYSYVEYRLYKRRFFGLAQLMLLNIVVSWGWIALAPVSSTAATYFETNESAMNWLSTAFLFAFVVATPATFFTLNKRGPKYSIVIATCLLLAGNWIKYGGTRSKTFAVVMLGQLLIGFAQPFVLSAPTTFSNVWFSGNGRTTATALASLANPFGAALGQLISPFWATSPSKIPDSILYVSIIATLACIPSFFIPAKPPTPPAPSADEVWRSTTSRQPRKSTVEDLRTLFGSVEFYLLFIPFAVYVGFFNAFSSLLNQILEPYGFSEDEAGIAGAVLIVVGLISAAISSPLIDKHKVYLSYIKVSVSVIALMYLVMFWAPETRSLPFVYVVCAVEGAASFGLVPVALEFLVEILHPLGPETGSTLCWSGGQLLGGVFIIVMDALRASSSADPPKNMSRALTFQAILAMVTLPIPLCLGLFGRKAMVRRKRWEFEQGQNCARIEESHSEGSRDETVGSGEIRM